MFVFWIRQSHISVDRFSYHKNIDRKFKAIVTVNKYIFSSYLKLLVEKNEMDLNIVLLVNDILVLLYK